MRIAFIADVHANLPALEAVIADAREHGATHLLCLGDIVGYGPQPAKTLERIREVASGIVLGNHDAAAAELIDLQYFNPFAKETAERAILALDDEAKAFLRTLPNLLEVKNIACSHSCFDAPETYRYLETEEDAARSLEAMPKFTLLIIGHTHVPCLFEQETPGGPVRKLPVADFQMRPGCRYVVNPGSVGFPRTDTLTADYLIYDTLMRRLTFRSLYYDLTPYRLALVRNGTGMKHYSAVVNEAMIECRSYDEIFAFLGRKVGVFGRKILEYLFGNAYYYIGGQIVIHGVFFGAGTEHAVHWLHINGKSRK